MNHPSSIAIALILFGLLGEAQGSENLPEIISQVPAGKLAFVTSKHFGSVGTISILGDAATAFKGSAPEISSDGTKIVYSNDEGSGSELYMRDLSRKSSIRIDSKVQDVDSPSLSPDGSKLAFVVWPKSRESSQIYLSDADGSNRRPLTEGSYYNWSPRLSPDGMQILFESTRDGQRQIYLMNADGQNQKNLTNDDILNHAPSWSPDGSQIAFMSRGKDNKANIFTMKIGGSDRKNISKGTTRDSEPVWSPDGKWIAFTRTANNPPKTETMDIWIMKSDGTGQRQITRNGGGFSSYQPSWGR